MSEWKEYILEDVIEKFIDYRGKTPKKTSFGIPLMTAKIIKGGRLLEPTEYIAKEDYLDWMTRGFPEINDVLLTTEAPLGEVALVKDKNVALGQRIITLQTRKDLCDSVFLKYYLQSFEGQATLQSRASGSTVEGIKSAELKKIEISLPPLNEQKTIALILFNLDNKIDLLHSQNTTLEKMAETLFRQWFVEEAKEEWEVVKMESLISIGSGKGLKKESFIENGLYPILGSNGEIGRTNDFLFDEKLIYTGRVGTLGNIFRIENEKVWLSDNTLVIKPFLYFNFIYLILKTSRLEDYNVGSTQPLIRQSDIKEIEIALPSKDKLIAFESLTDKIFQKIKSNQTQIRTLTALRDTLLPKLMSGEVTVQS